MLTVSDSIRYVAAALGKPFKFPGAPNKYLGEHTGNPHIPADIDRALEYIEQSYDHGMHFGDWLVKNYYDKIPKDKSISDWLPSESDISVIRHLITQLERTKRPIGFLQHPEEFTKEQLAIIKDIYGVITKGSFAEKKEREVSPEERKKIKHLLDMIGNRETIPGTEAVKIMNYLKDNDLHFLIPEVGKAIGEGFKRLRDVKKDLEDK